MKFYKIAKQNEYIGVADSESFFYFQSRHNLLLKSYVDVPIHYIKCKNKFYHDIWMDTILKIDNTEYEYANISEISESEYNILHEADEQELPELLTQLEEQNNPPPVVEETTDDANLEYLKEVKISFLSQKCNEAITSGISVTLSDGTEHYFTSTIEDQVNLLEAQNLILSGESSVIYHACGEEYKPYSAEDIQLISQALMKHKNEQLKYFYQLKQYINIYVVDTNTLANIYYGMEIPIPAI